MTVEVKIAKQAPDQPAGPIKVSIIRKGKKPIEVTIPFSLVIRRTIDGEIIILDHPEIDVSVIPSKLAVVVFPKEHINDETYTHSNNLMKYLHKKRVIKSETIKSGNVYGSLQAKIRDSISDDLDPLQITLLAIAQYIQEEKEYQEFTSEIKKEMEKRLFEPSDEESTELGEVPHEVSKGSIVPGLVRRYGQGFYYIYENKER